MWGSFEDVQVRQIPKEENTRVDKLSKSNPSDLQSIIRVLVEYVEQLSVGSELEVLVIATSMPSIFHFTIGFDLR